MSDPASLLVKDVASAFGGRVNVVTEEYGNSEMARRFGVRRYPVVFVDDVLVARPKDFGFRGPDETGDGLYVPWNDAANQQRFKADLKRFVARRLAGETVQGVDPESVRAEGAAPEDGPATLPPLTLTDVRGQPIDLRTMGERAVIVELWATWCPPCRSTLAWLDTLQRERGDRLTVLAIAVDSKAEDVSKMVDELQPSYRVVMGTPEVLAPFGAVAAVPKLFVFDPSGSRARVFYGAPPDLHEQVEVVIGK